MATLTIKNIPEGLRERLKESAAQHRRSINGEAISCLEKVLVGNRLDPEDFLAQVRSLRARMPGFLLRSGTSVSLRTKGARDHRGYQPHCLLAGSGTIHRGGGSRLSQGPEVGRTTSLAL